MVRDVCHMEKNLGSWSIRIFNQTQSRQPGHWICNLPISGTPLTSGPSDITEWINVMQTPDWNQDPVLKIWPQQCLKELVDRWNNVAIKKQESEVMREVITKFQPLVERICLRFTSDSRLLGEAPMKVSLSRYDKFLCDKGLYWNERVKNIQEAELRAFEDKERRHRADYKARFEDRK